MKIINENTVIKGNTSKTLVIFDLDDTLVITDAKIKVIDKNTGEVVRQLTPTEFNTFIKTQQYLLNFDDFENPEILERGRIIHKIFRLMRKWYTQGIPISIVTARSSAAMVRNFFLKRGIDIHPELVIAVNDPKFGLNGSTEERKKQAILSLIDKGFKYLIFFDDHAKNLEEVKTIEKIRKDVEITIVKV